MRLLPVSCMMHGFACLHAPLLCYRCCLGRHIRLCLSSSLSLPRGNKSDTACW